MSIGDRGPSIAFPRGILVALAALLFLGGCAPRLQELGPGIADPMMTETEIVASDGAALPLRRWLPEGEPVATILALHGFNDYSHAFELPGTEWAKHGIATYAYDQRGFGETDQVGLWPGTDRMIADLFEASALVRARHPDVPHFLLGESMGGAVVMAALDGVEAPEVSGAVLIAPAVWGRESQNVFETSTLWFFAHTMPWMKLTGEGLQVVPTDNSAILREMLNDPLVIKATRVDAIYGLVGLMDHSLAAVERMGGTPTLILYGAKEDVMPEEAVMRALHRLPPVDESQIRLGIYAQGYHMLLRDLGAETVWRDVESWIADRTRPLPSGADVTARRVLRGEDGALKDVAVGATSDTAATDTMPLPDPIPTQ